MNRHLSTLVAIIILAGAFTVSATAQTPAAQKVVASIPFAFNVGNTRLPAGRYTITVLNPTSDRKVLQIRSAKGRASAMVLTNTINGNASDDSKLVFQRYGDQYFFSEAHMAGDLTTLAAVKSNKHRAWMQTLAAANKRGIVVVTAE